MGTSITVGGVTVTNLREADIELVQEKFETAQGFALSAYQTTMGAINALQQIVQALQLINRQISIDTTQISGTQIEATPPVIDINQFRVDMPQLPADPAIIDASIGTLPDFPSVPTNNTITPPNENYYAYSRTLLDAIKSKLLDDVLAGSTGLTPAVEDAIFKREYERSLLEQQDLIDRIASHWSTRGWPLPNGALKAGIEQAEINFTNKRLDMSRDVAIKSFELALSNYHFIIEKGLGFESHLLSWAHSVADLAYQASKDIVLADIDIFKSLTEAASVKTRAVIDTALAKIAYNKGLIDYATAKLNAYSTYIRGQSDRVNAVARGYEAETAVFKAVTDFDISKAGLDLKVIETRMQQAIANANIMIKDKEIEMKNYEVLNSLKEEAMKAIGQIAAQLVAGALAAVHAAASIQASSNTSYSESTTGEIPSASG